MTMVKMALIFEVTLVYCNIFNKDYQQASKVFYRFVPNKIACFVVRYLT